jgi:hypothetical protein
VPQILYNEKPFGKATLLYERMHTITKKMGRLWIGSAAAMEKEWLQLAEIDVVICCVDG